MRAEIICVGSELLLGDILNTNAQYLSQKLAMAGVDVYYQSVVGDNTQRLTEVVQIAKGRSDVIVFCGGLGPTKDDLTEETVCRCFGIGTQLHQPTVQKIEQYYAQCKKHMTQNNYRQAMVPEGATVWENHHGSAPGCLVQKDGITLVFLPGPPSEFCPMVDEYLLPYFSAMSNKTLYSLSLREYGLGESTLETKITDLLEGQNPTVAVYAKMGEVEIRITAAAEDKQQAEQMCRATAKQIYERIGQYIYGENVDSMAQALVQQLKEKNIKIATAESCTGGRLAASITHVPGASQVFDMGASTYSVGAKQNILGIRSVYFKKYGAVSEQVAGRMAIGIQRRAKAGYGVGITGVAGPDTEENKPVGLVYIAVADQNRVYIKKCNFANHNSDREFVRTMACLEAMDMVRRLLNGLPIGDCKIYSVKKYTKQDRTVRRLDGLRTVAFYLALVVFIASLTMVVQYYYEGYQNQKDNDDLLQYYNSSADGLDIELPEGYQSSFAVLYSMNQDIAGWISMDGTQVNYPIVQAADNSAYLRTDYYGNYSKYGTLFFDYRNDIQAKGENLIIYGHNMKDSQMFGTLTNYAKESFYKEHPTFSMNTVYENRTYQVVAFFSCSADLNSDDYFDYYNRLYFSNQAALDEYLTEVNDRAYYDTGVQVNLGDNLLTLSTCGYEFDNQRYVVLAKQVQSEDAQEAVAFDMVLNGKTVATAADIATGFGIPTPLDNVIGRDGILADMPNAQGGLVQAEEVVMQNPTNNSTAQTGQNTNTGSSGSSLGDNNNSGVTPPANSGSGSNTGSSQVTQYPDDITGVSIMGSSTLTAKQLGNYVLAYNASPQIMYGTYSFQGKSYQVNDIYDFAQLYLDLGRAEGVRGDIAFCQAVQETGYFRFGGQVQPYQNNYAGIGALDGATSGSAVFSSPPEGVLAQIQHLKAYGSTAALNCPKVDPRFHYVSRGCAPTWGDLTGKWASDSSYGSKINAKVQLAKKF